MGTDVVLVVDADGEFRSLVRAALQGKPYRVCEASSLEEAQCHLEKGVAAVLLGTPRAGEDALDLLRRLHRRGLTVPPLVLVGGEHDPGLLLKAGGQGVLWQIDREGITHEGIFGGLREALGPGGRPENGDKLEGLRKRLVGESPVMRRIRETVLRAAATEESVLVLGENGCGKDLVAQCVHEFSSRFGGPFVNLHVATVDEGLAIAELFGHARGTYTGADRSRRGRIADAEGPTQAT